MEDKMFLAPLIYESILHLTPQLETELLEITFTQNLEAIASYFNDEKLDAILISNSL